MSLLALFISGFSSATFLPGSSESLFLLMLAQEQWDTLVLILVVGMGNSLGGMSNWVLGVLIRKGLHKQKEGLLESKHYILVEKKLQKFGAPILFFSFLPVVGDLLCMVAGLMKIHWLKSIIFISTGKMVRYILLSYIPV